MIPVQNLAYNVALNATQATNGATLTSGIVDMQGFHYATFVYICSTSNAASNTPSTLTVQTADVTAATSFVSDAALTFGAAAGNQTMPNAPTSTSNQPWITLQADWRGRPRYAQVLITPVTTQTFTVLVLKSRADIVPTSNTQINVSGGNFFG